jgi:hypothetical protein
MNVVKPITTALLLVLLQSCATKFTTDQRDSLSTLAVVRTEVNSDAYAEPYGGDRQTAGKAAIVGVTSGTGAIGGVLGSLIGETVAATQDNMFRSKCKDSFAAVQRNTPEVSSIVNEQLADGLKREAFYGPRVRKDSPNNITSKVTSYRLVRSGKDKDGNLLFTPQVIVEMGLKDTSGKNLANGSYVGTGYSHPISVYASSAAKSKEGYVMASKMAVDQFTTVLAKKAAD